MGIARITLCSVLTSRPSSPTRLDDYGTTSSPMLLALPTTLLVTRSKPNTFRSSSPILILAISYTCLTETLPTNPPPGTLVAPPLAARDAEANPPAVEPDVAARRVREV